MDLLAPRDIDVPAEGLGLYVLADVVHVDIPAHRRDGDILALTLLARGRTHFHT